MIDNPLAEAQQEQQQFHLEFLNFGDDYFYLYKQEDVLKALNEERIDAFIISSRSISLMRTLHFFLNNGFKIVGGATFEKDYKEFKRTYQGIKLVRMTEEESKEQF